MVSNSSLSAFIASNPDARELKRALAVQMTLLGLKQGAIQAILGVQSREHKAELAAGQVSAFFIDESHLHWHEACGYGWGRRDQRLEVAIENGRQRHTYYGALDIVKGTFLMQSYPKANAPYTVDFIRYLQQRRRYS